MLQDASGNTAPLKIKYKVGTKFIYAGDCLRLCEVLNREVKVLENHPLTCDRQAELRARRSIKLATDMALEGKHRIAQGLRKAADVLEQNNGALAEHADAGEISAERVRQLEQARSRRFRRPSVLSLARVLDHIQLTGLVADAEVTNRVRAAKTIDDMRYLLGYCAIRLANADEPRDQELFTRFMNELTLASANELTLASARNAD